MINSYQMDDFKSANECSSINLRCYDLNVNNEERNMNKDSNMNSDRDELIEKRTIQTDELKRFLNSRIKSRSNMRRWMRMGPIHPKRYHSIDQL